MDIILIKLLKLLIDGHKETDELSVLLGVKTRHLSNIIKKLVKRDYIKKEGKTIRLKDTPKVTLFRDVAQIADVERLLYRSNETVLASIDKDITIDELVKKSRLSKATTYRSISDLQSVGAITKEDNIINIDESKKQIVLFAKLLKIQREARYKDENIEVIYNSNDDSVILRKTSKGTIAKGVTTGFTLFSDFSIDYHSVYDYFCEQKEDLEIQDVLLHAVYASSYSRDKMGLLMAMIFYVKHKEKMHVLQLRKKSSRLGISGIWLDIESYIRRGKLKEPSLFLPWNEFVSKARLYDIPVDMYTLPKTSSGISSTTTAAASSLLFQKISNQLQESKTIYLFGGENMRIKSLKDSTKDCDIVVKDKDDFEDLSLIFTSMGYETRLKTIYSDEDRRIMPDDIFEHKHMSRIDLFTHTIMQELSLSPTIKERADITDYGRLKVGLLKNEDVFLLKSVANREGDIQDMAALVTGSPNTPYELQHGPFDWELVWDEIKVQERINKTTEFTITIFEQMSYLAEQTGIVSPFLDKLRRHVTDEMIKKLLRGGSMSIKEIVDYLKGGKDITETVIRNRINTLEKSKIIKKYPTAAAKRGGEQRRTAHVKLLKDNEYLKKELKINMHRLKTWLDWRFYTRPRQSDQNIQKLVGEVKKMGFQRIGEIDYIIRNFVEILQMYENKQFSKQYFDTVNAVRICIKLHCLEGDRKMRLRRRQHPSKHFTDEFKKYCSSIAKQNLFQHITK